MKKFYITYTCNNPCGCFSECEKFTEHCIINFSDNEKITVNKIIAKVHEVNKNNGFKRINIEIIAWSQF